MFLACFAADALTGDAGRCEATFGEPEAQQALCGETAEQLVVVNRVADDLFTFIAMNCVFRLACCNLLKLYAEMDDCIMNV